MQVMVIGHITETEDLETANSFARNFERFTTERSSFYPGAAKHLWSPENGGAIGLRRIV